MKKIIPILLSFCCFTVTAQTRKISESEVAVNSMITGTLFTPENVSPDTKLVILIAGSGPTDRFGNQMGLENNSLKLLAQYLTFNGNAVYTYDKRIIALAKTGGMKEEMLNFEDFITDAKEVIAFFKGRKTYSKIIVAGHSEGSLIGMEAARGNADAFISIAGAGRQIDEVIMDQLNEQPQDVKDDALKYFASLKEGKTFQLENQSLAMLFRESVQPYLISWIKYSPQDQIKLLKIPVLLINGTKDLQVAVSEAELLKKAKPDAELAIITNMNHVLKTIEGGASENIASYSSPDLPDDANFLLKVNQFIKSL